jgi:hypothetical protein
MAGGLSVIADSTRATIEPLSERGGARVVEIKLPGDAGTPLTWRPFGYSAGGCRCSAKQNSASSSRRW